MKRLILVIVLPLLLLHSRVAHSQNKLPAFIDSLMSLEIKASEPGGVVLVAKNGAIVYKKAFGMAQMELQVPMQEDMIFYIGSNTKQFTAVCILQLYERGKLQLNDTIGKYILCPPPIGKITIQQLLSQTSGLGGNLREPMKFVPGTRWEYNNENYQLLGQIIEKVSGMSYADYLEKNIFIPAGMLSSYMSKELLIIPKRATGYSFTRNGFRNLGTTNPKNYFASGGIQSTVEDLFKWNQALRSGRLIKPATLTMAISPQPLAGGSVTKYGFGWHLEEVQQSPTYRHGGLVPGYTSETLYFPSEDTYVVMMANSEHKVQTIALTRIIGAMTINKPYNFSAQPIDNSSLQAHAGLYENSFGEMTNVVSEDGKLFFHRPNGTKTPMFYAGNEDFFFEKDYIRFRFQKDASDKIINFESSKVGLMATIWTKTNRPLLKLAAERASGELIARFPGKYYAGINDTVEISRDGFSLHLQRPGKSPLLLAAETPHRYFALREDIQIEFNHEHETLILFQDKKKKSAAKLK